jgi:hypothetical protein
MILEVGNVGGNTARNILYFDIGNAGIGNAIVNIVGDAIGNAIGNVIGNTIGNAIGNVSKNTVCDAS